MLQEVQGFAHLKNLFNEIYNLIFNPQSLVDNSKLHQVVLRWNEQHESTLYSLFGQEI